MFDILVRVFDPEILLKKGQEAEGRGHLNEARDLYAQAVAEARWVEGATSLSGALRTFGGIERRLLHLDTSLQAYAEAASVSHRQGDLAGEVEALLASGEILAGRKQIPEAEKILNHALELSQAAQDPQPLPQARALHGLALLSEVSNPQETLLLWQAAATMYEAAGSEEKVTECKRYVAFLLGI